ncbi:MAG: PP2C family protein-serine/threonine phosphatase [Candidatus Promineifilaceae bacterium]
MNEFLSSLARRIWPQFDTLSEPDRLSIMGELVGTLLGLPFVILALVWLFAATDVALLREEWAVLLLILGLSVLAGRLSFFRIVVGEEGNYDYSGSSLEIVIVASAVLLFGPTAGWIPFFGRLIDFGLDTPRSPSTYQQWNRIRNLVFNIGWGIVGLLLVQWVYQLLGGQFPLAGFTAAAVWPAFVAITLWLPWDSLFFLIHGILITRFQLAAPARLRAGIASRARLLRFIFVAQLPAFFGILAAATYSQMGLFAYLYLLAGVLLASLLARRLSQQAMLSQQRSREVAQLERLGRAILAAPADASMLPELLATYIPQMFGYQQVEIHLFSGITYLRLPDSRQPVDQRVWDWLEVHPKPHFFAPGETPPWTDEANTLPLYLSPILSTDTAEPLGGIYLTLNRLHFEEAVMALGPALQVLAAQIATALHQAEVQQQTLDHQRTVQELDFAWQIQASFLPAQLPQVEGWELATVLQPCQETSGDFYDVIPLPDERLGLLVADVADKGLGAALFMALSRTLLRTYAFEYPAQPELVLMATNQRILSDTHSDMFVTVFYGILELTTGRLTYANAGHNPPFVMKRLSGDVTESAQTVALTHTGMPLGILEDATWEARSILLDHGDTLLLYTDGVTEAENQQGELFGDQRLLAVAADNSHVPLSSMQDAVLAAVDRFSVAGAHCDDQTLLIVRRQ